MHSLILGISVIPKTKFCILLHPTKRHQDPGADKGDSRVGGQCYREGTVWVLRETGLGSMLRPEAGDSTLQATACFCDILLAGTHTPLFTCGPWGLSYYTAELMVVTETGWFTKLK